MWESFVGRWNVCVPVGVTIVAGIALVVTLAVSSRRGGLRSPWSTRRRKQPLDRELWDSLLTDEGKLINREIFLEKVRGGGIEPNIRPIVWPFLLGVYDLCSTEDQRNATNILRRKAYKILRKKCKLLWNSCVNDDKKGHDINGKVYIESDRVSTDEPKSSFGDDSPSATQSAGNGLTNDINGNGQLLGNVSDPGSCIDAEEKSSLTDVGTPNQDCDSSDSESSVQDLGNLLQYMDTDKSEGNVENNELFGKNTPKKSSCKTHRPDENFITWQRIIRLDAIRANDEWIPYAPEQAEVSLERARGFAEESGLVDYDHLESCRIYHAARLVAILEAYALYDPEIGYCQGMSDLLSPILSVIGKDDEAFWCFVGFMKKARHNFRLDEVGIRRQLNIVSKIIKFKDMSLYRHLEKLQAEDCFFVYRMVVVLFRRELNFEQTLCLWEVMWADQAAIRAGIGRSTWGRIRPSVPPTDDLLLYAIAASVLQKRKLIIEKYDSMEEIMKECHSMSGHLDVWKLLDDAHELVVKFHAKIS